MVEALSQLTKERKANRRLHHNCTAPTCGLSPLPLVQKPFLYVWPDLDSGYGCVDCQFYILFHRPPKLGLLCRQNLKISKVVRIVDLLFRHLILNIFKTYWPQDKGTRSAKMLMFQTCNSVVSLYIEFCYLANPKSPGGKLMKHSW